MLFQVTLLTSLVDRGMQFYKTSTLRGHGRQSVTMTTEDSAGDHTRVEQSTRQSWEDESLIRQGQSTHSSTHGNGELTVKITANSSLPVVRQMVHTERVGEGNQADRMSLWLQNVESEKPLLLLCRDWS
jgi:hypothetical protein